METMQKHSLSFWLCWFALLPAGLFAGLWMVFGMREVLSGERSALSHLLPALIIVLLVLNAWKQPRTGGIALLLAGTAILIYLSAFIQSQDSRLPGALLTGGPFLLSGFLFWLAGVKKSSLIANA